jgi:hypothetical protein
MTDELTEAVGNAIDAACIAYSKSHAGLGLRKWDTPGEVMATAAIAAVRAHDAAQGYRLVKGEPVAFLYTWKDAGDKKPPQVVQRERTTVPENLENWTETPLFAAINGGE